MPIYQVGKTRRELASEKFLKRLSRKKLTFPSHTDLKDLFEIFLRAQKNFSNGSAEKAHHFPQKTITQKNFSTRSAKKKVVLRW